MVLTLPKLTEYLNDVEEASIVKLNPGIRFQIFEPLHKREIANEFQPSMV